MLALLWINSIDLSHTKDARANSTARSSARENDWSLAFLETVVVSNTDQFPSEVRHRPLRSSFGNNLGRHETPTTAGAIDKDCYFLRRIDLKAGRSQQARVVAQARPCARAEHRLGPRPQAPS